MIKWLLAILFLLPCMVWADSVTRRPSAEGNYDGNWIVSTGTDQWAMIDEATSDDDGTYIYSESANRFSCTFPTTPAVPSGATDISVTVHYISKKSGALGSPAFTPFLRFSSTDNDGSAQSLTTSYVEYSEAISKPGGGDWTVAEVNGISWEAGGLHNGSGNNRCTQLWVVISYTPAATSKPRVTSITRR